MILTPDEIARARAIPIYTLVARDCKIIGDYAFCPFHGPEKTPSLHIHRRGNFFKCFGCPAKGDSIEWVKLTRKVDFPTAVRELSAGCGGAQAYRRGDLTGLGRPPDPSRQDRDQKPQPHSLVLWRTADAPKIAELYLASRGLRVRPKPLPEALRGHRAVWCAEAHEHRPATLAALTDASGALLSVQRIYCSLSYETINGQSPAKGTRATDLRNPKKGLGPMRDGAVRLCEPGPMLGLTEGVEDALAVRQIYSIPCWAMLGGGRLGALAVPKVTKEVVIFGDGDAAGRELAEKAARTYRSRGLSTGIIYPSSGAKDFCEELNGKSAR